MYPRTAPRPVEEKLSSITHAIGAGLAIAALISLLVVAAPSGNRLLMVTLVVYGVCQLAVYVASALTHGFYDMEKPATVFRVVDQTAIYFLIAGTYTPVALAGVGGAWGWWLFGIEWALALGGVVLKGFVFRGEHLLSDILYLPMGWLILVAVRPLLETVGAPFLWWALAGGLAYSIGVAFYMNKKMPLSHVVWHLFVIGGGCCFYLGILLHVIPAAA